jgi:hypothetical protein
MRTDTRGHGLVRGGHVVLPVQVVGDVAEQAVLDAKDVAAVQAAVRDDDALGPALGYLDVGVDNVRDVLDLRARRPDELHRPEVRVGVAVFHHARLIAGHLAEQVVVERKHLVLPRFGPPQVAQLGELGRVL